MFNSFSYLLITTSFLIISCLILSIQTHGRLAVPPARSSAWREDKRFPIYYDDNQMYCGGRSMLWKIHGGKCGICGEVYNETKLFELGGMYYLGIPVRTYSRGQIIDVKVEISANHLGWFEFRICNVDSLTKDATQDCLDRTLLQDLGGNTRISLQKGVFNFETKLRLPDYLWCDHCVMQWKYQAGNSWDTDKLTGESCVGCGAQEQFYGCSDIKILNTIPNTTLTSASTHASTTLSESFKGIEQANYTRILTFILAKNKNNNNQDKFVSKIQNKTGIARKVLINLKPYESLVTKKMIKEPFTIRKRPNEGILCPNGDGYYPNLKSNCRQYYICVHSGTAFERIIHYSCPNGMAFERRLKICNLYDSIICN